MSSFKGNSDGYDSGPRAPLQAFEGVDKSEKVLDPTKSRSEQAGEFAGIILMRERLIPRNLKLTDTVKFLKTRRVNSSRLFLDDIFEEKVPEEMLKDEVLGQNLTKALDIKLKGVERKVAFKRLRRSLRKYVDVDGKHISDVLSRNLERNLKTDVSISLFEGQLNANDESKAFKEWHAKLLELEDSYVDGEVDDVEYARKLEELYAFGVSSFGDESVKEVWKAHSDREMYFDWTDEDEQFELELEEGEASLAGASLNAKEADDAMAETVKALDGTGVRVYGEVGSMSVATSDGFSLPLAVRLSNSGQFLYYLRDFNADDGIVGPLEVVDIPDELDKRGVDSVLSEHFLRKNSHDSADSLANVPDEDLVKLSAALIGQGDERGYTIDSENKFILDSLAAVLAVDESKNSGLYYKIETLNRFVEDANQASYLKRQLRLGRVVSVSTLIEEYDSENL